MKITITDPWLGEREVSGTTQLIADQLELLKAFRDDGRVPSQHLLDDIKVYEFILNSQDPDVYAANYMLEATRMRAEQQDVVVSKMDIAKKLGWGIE